MDEHDIEVAERAERAPAVPTDGDESQVPLGVAGGPFGQAGEPGVGFGRIPPAEFLPPQPGLGQELAAPVTQ